jgi:hypothetical protein
MTALALKPRTAHLRLDLSGWTRHLPDWWSCWMTLPTWH